MSLQSTIANVINYRAQRLIYTRRTLALSVVAAADDDDIAKIILSSHCCFLDYFVLGNGTLG